MMRGATETQYAERAGLTALLESGHIHDRSVAIDGGAHVGTWAELLADAFETVHAFEPSPAFDDLAFNAASWPNVTLHNAALVDEPCRIESYHRRPGGKLTSYRIRKTDAGPSAGMTIDSLGLERCGLIKLDIEGAEYLALTGAAATIARCRPFLLVEMYGRGGHLGYSNDDVRGLINIMGYREVWAHHVDIGFAPREDL